MLKNWIKIFWYNVKANTFFTVLNTFGLSLGIAGLVFALLYWNDEHSYNAWNPEKDKVYQVINNLGNDMIWATSVAPLGPHLDNIPEIEQHCYTRLFYFDEIIKYGQKREQIKILDVQKNFFAFFPFEFVKGNGTTAIQDDASIALEEGVAQRLFGNEDPMGKWMQYGTGKFLVRGVYRIPGNSSLKPLAVTNLIEPQLKQNLDQWGNFNFGLFVKLKNPAQADLVKKKIDNVFLEYRTKRDAKEAGISLEEYIKRSGSTTVILEPLATARLHSLVEGYPEGRGNYQFLLIMLGLSVLILILSIVNYINLATANTVKRAKEIGVRKIMGADKANIVKQFIFETFLTTTIALLLALVIVELGLPFYNSFLHKSLELKSAEFFMQLLAVLVVVIVLAGIFPALYVSNFKTLMVLKGNFSRSKNGIWLRNAMLVLQFAIAAFFITGSYIVYQQVSYMSHKDLGLKGDQVIDVTYRGQRPQPDDPSQIYAHYETIRDEVLKIKGVQSVSAGAFSLGTGAGSTSGFAYKDHHVQGQNMAVDFDFLDMMQIKLTQGRGLSANFSSDTINGMLINETAMKMMREKDPIGKKIDWNGEKLNIVGVVKDFHMFGPHEKIPPMSFFHFKTIDWMSYNLNHIYIKIDPADMEGTLKALDAFWTTKVDTEYPFSYDFVDKNFARTYENYVQQRNLFSLLNGVVIFIALFGLFALASYTIQRRMKEIAIRKTLGAGTATLLKELSKQYVVYCIIGFLIALAPAWMLLNKWLENFAFRITISAWPFVVGFVALLMLTLAVVLGKAYKATRVDVLKYLKYE
ncbi:multidrug ABC transporter substrate-binding protein [Flavobacterium akiainvivens]|uniref:Multidrug ABC transporter substrate-binding protein n=1 Tax=Flavobacterium akiainvivens TaxID=1202724 RepID=A0A0M8MC08_9FLAO|nr:ABC transporter permease [Flavobacterium akiainvivens]KOS05594.1 multidrug ABC transporter substrate-binding protein [Flavobacterium akiainvivens]SFQ34986.1 putative ABC transport system permease protein [Flavobacterium akiainvivens]